MDELEKLGLLLKKERDRNKDLYVRTRVAEQKYERIFRYLQKLPCTNKYCDKGELWQWKYNGRKKRRRYKIGTCQMCLGKGSAAAAFEVKEKRDAQ